MELINKYNIYIRDSYDDLIFSGKKIDNYDLDKIFEYYSCIQLSKKYKKQFYEYNDIDPTFKEQNKMTRNDTGIDACNLIDTIVQCKLRKDSLRWEDCGTFFGSQNIFDSVLKKTIVKWDNLIITRNKECKLSKNLKEKQELFTDITYSRDEIIDYCNNLIKNPPKIKKIKDDDFKLRDYQLEAIEIINNNKNVIISLPTGCGKNVVIIYSIDEKKRYLILVPRIILMEQIKTEIIKHRPELNNKIQTIGDNNNEYDKTKNITICVYNSISVIEKYGKSFDKIFVDEAHHINIPEIYEIEEIDDNESIEENDNIINDDESNVLDEESILKDDTEDEIKNTTGYNKIIKSLSKYNNNVYLSATIDEIKEFTYYKKDIRDMIDNKYLCDYTIHIPIFSDDPSNKNICEYLLKNYRNIIIYCNSQKEGKKINDLLNTLQKGCSEYIDCKTSQKDRYDIIKSYKDGEIPFLVNVRILVEGFDAPITKGVCFIHLPSSKTTIIQIIGRALRLHSLKTYANIILPFSSKDDETNINKFLKILAQNDKRIKKSYESKTEGGYISIEKIKDDKENKNIEFRYNMIYNSMGILQNWIELLEGVKKFIDDNKRRPKQKEKIYGYLGGWLSNQLNNYNKKLYKTNVYNNQKIFEKFLKDYEDKLLSGDKLWIKKYNDYKDWTEENKRIPINTIYNKLEKNIWNFWNNCRINYNKKKLSASKLLSINKLKYWSWSILETKFSNNYDEIKKWIEENKKIPRSTTDNELEKKCGTICQNLRMDYKNEKLSKTRIELLENLPNWYWNKYQEEFIVNYDKVKKWTDINKIIPSNKSSDGIMKEIGIICSNWRLAYKKGRDTMTNKNIELIEKLPKWYWQEIDTFDDKYSELINWNIKNNNKIPSNKSKNEIEKKLGNFCSNHRQKYKKNKLEDEKIKKLEKVIGWYWTTNQETMQVV